MRTSLILSHDPQLEHHRVLAGLLPEILQDLGYAPKFRSFVTGAAPREYSDLLLVMGSFDSTLNLQLPWLAAERQYIRKHLDTGSPAIGICFGGQLLAELHGGEVTNAAAAEYGFISVDPTIGSFIEAGPWPSFHYQAFSLPQGAALLAETPFANQAFLIERTMGLQFHPELTVAAAEVLLATDPTMLNTEESRQFLSMLASQQDELYERTKRMILDFLTTIDR